jgi:S-adenosylmethionine-diacylglycerol 3-amino-3-carboxypropyl transferase
VKHLIAKVKHAVHDRFFQKIHGSRLIYNTCWEDPRIDRELLELNGDSRVVVITSAGCNVLDYLMDGPAEIHSVDVNPRQNALLQLKLALIAAGDYDDFFEVFGRGRHDDFQALYGRLAGQLPPEARDFWGDKAGYFSQRGLKKSFYYHGTTGMAAWLFLKYLYLTRPRLRSLIFDLVDARSLDQQRRIYDEIEGRLWGGFSLWLVRQPALMTLLGVPRPQIRLIQTEYPGGLSQFVRDKMRHVFTEVVMADNYFWRVYITGEYTAGCCPNYIRPDNFAHLHACVDRVRTYTGTLSAFLKERRGAYTHFVLLDHQDWLAWHAPEALEEEWRLILANSRPGARILMRSAGFRLDFIPRSIAAALRFRPDLTEPLHPFDRVGTYGSLHFAEVV